MRATKSSVFIQAIAIAALALVHEWAWIVAPVALIHLLIHFATAPKLKEIPRQGHHGGVISDHSRVYQLHHPSSPQYPAMPQPGDNAAKPSGMVRPPGTW